MGLSSTSTDTDTVQDGTKLTNTNVNLPNRDLVRNLRHRRKTRRALAVDRVHGCCVRDTGCESSHARCARTAAGREDVSDGDVLDECGVEPGLGVYGAEDFMEDFFRAGVLETAALALHKVTGWFAMIQ